MAKTEKTTAPEIDYFSQEWAISDGVMNRQVPQDLAEYKDGTYKHLETGEHFRLKLVNEKDAGLGKRTHRLKNALHTWEGTAGEFKETFEKA